MDELGDVNKPVAGDSGNADADAALGGPNAADGETRQDTDTVVARFEKSAMEEVRVTLGRYMGREVFGVRVWVGLTNGTMRPTRKGVTLRLDTFPDFLAATRKLEAAVNERGSREGEPVEGGD
jgi:hypothetical protein